MASDHGRSPTDRPSPADTRSVADAAGRTPRTSDEEVTGDVGQHIADTLSELLSKGPAFVLHALMDFIVDQYFPIVDALGEELESLEQRVFTQPFSRRTTTQIYKLKRDLIALKRVVAPVIEAARPKAAAVGRARTPNAGI